MNFSSVFEHAKARAIVVLMLGCLTIGCSSGSRGGGVAAGGWCIRITEDLGNNVAFNNILIREGSGGGSLALDNTTGFASANNALTGRLSLDRGNTILSLADWQAAGYGQGSFTTTSTQLFVSPGASDYHLSATSTAIDKGAWSFSGRTAPAVDAEANARPQGAAHELR